LPPAPADRLRVIAFFNQMLFVMARTRSGQFRARLRAVSRSVLPASFRQRGLTVVRRWTVWVLVCRRLQMEGCSLRFIVIVGYSADAGCAPVRRRRDTRYRPDSADFRCSCPRCFVLVPAVVYSQRSFPLDGLSVSEFWQAKRHLQRQHHDRIAGPHYMSSGRPGRFWYVRSGSVRQARRGVGRCVSGNPLVLCRAAALANALRDFIVRRGAGRIPDPGVLLRALSLLGDAPAALGFLYYYLPAATFASVGWCICCGGKLRRWLLWSYVVVAAAVAAMLPILARYRDTMGDL